jgi:peptidoglycan/LPS O-acetylase OafA/YrhL
LGRGMDAPAHPDEHTFVQWQTFPQPIYYFCVAGRRSWCIILFHDQRVYTGAAIHQRKNAWWFSCFIKKILPAKINEAGAAYLAALLLSFILLVLVKGQSFTGFLPHLGASSIYMHNIIYTSPSSVLGVAWSLEVEVQFYILAPFLCFIFLIKHQAARRIILILLILLSGIYAFYSFWKLPTILPYFICYFLSGMFLADLYCNGHRLKLNKWVGLVTGICILLGLPFIISVHSVWFFLLKLFLMNAAFYLVLFNAGLKKMMSWQLITIIGGMCYSIYLLHVLIMSGLSQGLAKLPLLHGYFGIIVYAILLIAAVLVFSAVFYRLIEQPCMRKDWWKRIKK